MIESYVKGVVLEIIQNDNLYLLVAPVRFHVFYTRQGWSHQFIFASIQGDLAAFLKTFEKMADFGPRELMSGLLVWSSS